MENQKKDTKLIILKWLKRLFALFTIVAWIVMLVLILGSGLPFAQQAPRCIIGTMIIFGILTISFKGIEYYEKQLKDESEK